MKILHVLYSGLGGHGNVFFSMVTADNNNEFEYEALFHGIEELRSEYIAKCNRLGIQWHYVKKNSRIDFKYYLEIFKIVRNNNANILFLHSSTYILPAKLANLFSRKKKRIIIRETQANNLKTKENWLWLSAAFLYANTIVFLSEEYRNEVKKKLSRFYREKKVAVIPNGIDLTVFYPLHKNDTSRYVIGMQSRLTDNKDHGTLLRAFALLKNKGLANIKLKIAGDGSCKPGLLLLSQNLKINNDVEFTGMLEEDELVRFLQHLNVYIHASYGETMSTAIMQAMASRLPVIASDVPGIKNMIVNNETGILVPVRNENLMADAIQKLLDNPFYADLLGENAYNFAIINYSNSVMFKKYKELFSL